MPTYHTGEDADTPQNTKIIPEFTIKSPVTPVEFERYYALRWAVLRAPWGQSIGSERDEEESQAIHLMACDEKGYVIGVGRGHFIDAQTAQIRYMAVNEHWQGKQVGSKILKELEKRISASGAKFIILNARESVLPFYLRHGYNIVGKGPTLYGSISHQKMQKNLLDK